MPLITVTAEFSILRQFDFVSQRTSSAVNVTLYLVSMHINTTVVNIIELEDGKLSAKRFYPQSIL